MAEEPKKNEKPLTAVEILLRKRAADAASGAASGAASAHSADRGTGAGAPSKPLTAGERLLQQKRSQPVRKVYKPRDHDAEEVKQLTEQAKGIARQATAGKSGDDHTKFTDDVWAAVQDLQTQSPTQEGLELEDDNTSPARRIAQRLVKASQTSSRKLVEQEVRRLMGVDELGKGGIGNDEH